MGILQRYIRDSRVARLATVDASGQPLVVPICYACDGQHLYSVIDEKPKRVPAGRLKRVRNIRENPKVSLVIDDFDEDWSKLRHVIIQGEAEILLPGTALEQAIALLRRKYPQYQTMSLDKQPVIRITPKRVIQWNMTSS
ncbi:TIGR03668 family PPOX class F420-dependent oxidoreductase [Acidobacteria bacterium AH-259-D05]|nr:TIGR03668 family PPOX class F420-dependent oxidoreductase [Acidobacteria bacterium AH-259-D05]